MSAADFLRASMARGFSWGETDCALWSADFWQFETGYDPAKALRGTYSSRVGCFDILKRNGGLRNTARACMATVTTQPLGNVGICVAKVGPSDLCGVFSDGVMHVLTERNSIRLVRNYRDLEGWSW